MNYKTNLSIKLWAEEDRPREKLIRLGSHNLSDAELIAIILKTGTVKFSALDIARNIMDKLNHDLNSLAKCKLEDLTSFSGVGPSKAVTLMATMELGKRRQMATIKSKPKIQSSREAYDIIGPTLQDLAVEEFWIILLNSAGRLVSRECISRGGINSTVVDSRIIFKRAIAQGATSIILIHNHPSGKTTPSSQDISLTKNLVASGKILGIPISDHLIIGDRDYYSFCDEGKLT